MRRPPILGAICLQLSFGHQLSERYAQPISDPGDRGQGQVSCPPFDGAVIGAVHANGIRERVLTVSEGLAPLAYRGAKLGLQSRLVHVATVRRRYF